METWQFIYDKLFAGHRVILLCVLESEGSSPGRQGFKMAVANDGGFFGTIGGGIMEYKLVEKAKALLVADEEKILLVRQYHDKEHNKDQSGMICSGNQLIALVTLAEKNIAVIQQILQAENHSYPFIHLFPAGINLASGQQAGLYYKSEQDWHYFEPANPQPVIHIIGGGHVGLALCQLLSFLGLHIYLYDNRPGVNSSNKNGYANKIYIIDYNSIGALLPSNKKDYVVIATFGYRDDKIVFKQLLNKEFFYIGMMGSDAKIKTLFKELEEEGICPKQFEHCFAPIGINIHSQTAQEIAVSIAAEIIREKNKNLPSGRQIKSG